MARSTQTRASDAPRDAYALLKQDHRAVEALLDQFENAEEDEQGLLAERICQMLTVHAQIEEEILYPAAKEALQEDEEEAELVVEAAVEHASAKDLIAQIESMTPDDEAFSATVKVLGEYVKHHVKEEENELFKALRQTDIDAKAIGARLAERKFELMEQMGIEPMEEPAPARKKSTTRAKKSSSAKSRQARAGSRASSSRNSGRAARH